MEKTVEICCGSYEDAWSSYQAGASRIELNSALYLGGLTPSLGTLLLVKEKTDLKVICMDRPRPGGFCYNEKEFETMVCDARLLMEKGSDGIAFGCLNSDGTINEGQTRTMVSIIKEYHGEAVFHRAFDCVEDPFKAIETLIDLGVNRLLTSGLKEKALDGKDLIKQLQSKFGDKIEILAGSGINVNNARELMEKTGIYQIHSSCKDWLEDPTTNMGVAFGYACAPHQNDYEVVSGDLVKQLIISMK